MKGEELAPVEHIVQTLQEKTRRVVELAPKIWKVMRSEDNEISQRWRLLMVCNFLSARGIGAIQVYIVLFIVI